MNEDRQTDVTMAVEAIRMHKNSHKIRKEKWCVQLVFKELHTDYLALQYMIVYPLVSWKSRYAEEKGLSS